MTNNQLTEDILAIQNETSLDGLLKLIEKHTKLLGFEYYSFGHLANKTYGEPKFELFNNYKKKWQNTYTDNKLYENDSLVTHAVKTTSPLIWDGSLFSNSKKLQEGAHAFGIDHGWSQATRNESGVSMLTLVRSSESLTTSEINTKTANLMWLTQVFNTAINKLLSTPSTQELNIQLTLREREILRWTADGKTSFEISIILSISERTVNFHLNNCMSKLAVNNRISAVVKAISFGLL